MKTYTVIKHRKGRTTETTGTVAELAEHFQYTLDAGNSYDSDINTEPRTITSLVSNLNKAVDELQKGSFSPDYYERVKN